MLIINGKEINQDSTSFVIAEIGNNHQGSLDLAKQLVDEAKGAGASAIKTQRRNNKKSFTLQIFSIRRMTPLVASGKPMANTEKTSNFLRGTLLNY